MTTRLVLLLLLAVPALPAGAQLAGTIPRSKTTGLMLSGGGQWTAIRFAGADSWQEGFGSVVQVGYGFSSLFAVMAGASTATMRSAGRDFPVHQLDASARLHLTGANWRWVPFIEIGVASRRATHEDFEYCVPSECQVGDVVRSGIGYAQSIGVSFYPMRRFAVTAAGQFIQGAFDNVKFNGVETLGLERDANSGRLFIGGTWIVSPGGR